jgi:hypothetical protein
MCVIELEPCSVWQEREVTAKKAHACDCCGGEIAAGARYTRHFSIFEGNVTCEKMCAACLEVREAFNLVHGTHGNPGSMRALLDECVSEEWTWLGGDSDTKKLTEIGALWQQALDEMKARRTARTGATHVA